ncbi:GNAT family N-acetyltransferase [Abyssisolibacter fermentans]|uniref:GNAT family N-acetyltransferase n=1 Tax=Abyssisolibacter fermentans TaxID=1766203 RepID=UPI000836F7C4|nr:GNAT family N-acetyltransferase [Abyssisolibacter fermentans]
MNVTIKKVTKDNWKACIKLELDEQQKDYLPSNLYSIAESKFIKNMENFAVYHEQEVIGFVAYVLDDDGDMNLTRFMIDKKHQRKGYGKVALKKIINLIKDNYDNKEIWLSLHPENKAAIKLYTSCGFDIKVIGLESKDEIFLRCELSR